MKKNYRIKKTISIKYLIAELGEHFSEHTKKRLLDLEIRCVLTRKNDNYRFDIKHVEHTKYDCCQDTNSTTCEKEYAYGQFVIDNGVLYFSNNCIENDDVMQNQIANTIYNSLNSVDMLCSESGNAKKIDNNNIDYVIDSLLTACPEVSQRYRDIVKDILSRERI